MKWFSAIGVLLLVSAAMAQDAAPVLELQDAIDLALSQNRALLRAALEADKSGDDLAAVKSHYYPAFNISVLGGHLLKELDFTFERGVFGEYPGIGPIPSETTAITTPRQLTAYVVGSIQQPLSQLYRIKLSARLQESLGIENAEKHREEKHSVINQVKKAYYAVVQAGSSLLYAKQQVELYRELDRITEDYVAREVALKSDSLQVKATLAKAEYDALTAANQLATQKEQLNLLLGRPIDTEFSTNAVPEETVFESDPASARAAAMERRPEIRKALARVQQADYDRRIKKAEYIPDVSVSLNYIAPVNIDFVPDQIASVGIYFSWDLYDWGRKGHELESKSRTIEQAKLALTETRDSVQIDVNSQLRKLQESRELVRIAKLGQDAAEENLRVVKSRYAEQSTLLKDVLAAQNSVEETRDSYEKALLSFWVARADFEKSIGEDNEE